MVEAALEVVKQNSEEIPQRHQRRQDGNGCQD